MRRGDVWWATHEGHRRPVLILTRDPAIPLLNRLHVVPATRTQRGAPSEVPLTRADGMPEDCVLSIDNMKLLPKRALRNRITTLSASRLEQVCERLAYALGC